MRNTKSATMGVEGKKGLFVQQPIFLRVRNSEHESNAEKEGKEVNHGSISINNQASLSGARHAGAAGLSYRLRQWRGEYRRFSRLDEQRQDQHGCFDGAES